MSTTIQHISSFVDRWAPERTQMDFDNVGVLVGDPQARVDKIITCLDVTPDLVEEAVEWDTDLIVAHHPLIFNKLEKITPTDDHGRMIYRLIQNNIGVLAAHTNLDAARGGVSMVLAEEIGLQDISFLDTNYKNLHKIIFSLPANARQNAQSILDDHRAGNTRFLNPVDDSKSLQAESLVEDHQMGSLISRLQSEANIAAGSIETYQCENSTDNTGMGAIGVFEHPLSQQAFLNQVAENLNVPAIRYSGAAENIQKVAVCGGAGVFLTSKAIEAGADAFITGDIKYHNYFTEQEDFILADVGHYESEIPIARKLQEELSRSFDDIEVTTTNIVTNPMNVFTSNKDS